MKIVFDLFFYNYIGSFWRPLSLKFLRKWWARKKEKKWRNYHFISTADTLIDHAARNHSVIVKIKIWSIIYKLWVNNLASGMGYKERERLHVKDRGFASFQDVSLSK